MPRPPKRKNLPGLNIRDLSEDLHFRIKLAAVVERKTVRAFVLDLVEARLKDLTKKGLLPKGK